MSRQGTVHVPLGNRHHWHDYNGAIFLGHDRNCAISIFLIDKIKKSKVWRRPVNAATSTARSRNGTITQLRDLDGGREAIIFARVGFPLDSASPTRTPPHHSVFRPVPFRAHPL